MGNLLLQYMNERGHVTPHPKKEPGPVITISREFGCSASTIAQLLKTMINEALSEKELRWNWINRRILTLASSELKIEPKQLDRILNGEDDSFLDHMVSSYTSQHFVHTSQIKLVIEDIVRTLALSGNIIIVGRASEVITQDIKRSLHVRLHAPLEWRINRMSTKLSLTPDEARKMINRVDKQRLEFRNSYMERKKYELLYTVDFNVEQLSPEEVAKTIYAMGKIKGLITS